MPRPVTLFTGQWADLSLATLAEMAADWGYDGLELACWGDHFEVDRALEDDAYLPAKRDLLDRHGLTCTAVSTHLVGQCVCDPIDERHRGILSEAIWGDGDPEGVRQRAAAEVIRTAEAAAAFGATVVNGFTGSSIWAKLYFFPPTSVEEIDAGYQDFADRWGPILDVFDEEGVRFALEVHPTEIAFDVVTAERALDAVGRREAFGFNYDPSHLAYQGVDLVDFVLRFAERIYHVHMKDVWWSDKPEAAGVFGGHENFGSDGRFRDFCSLGRGKIDFEAILRHLNRAGYGGALTLEWEDPRSEERRVGKACSSRWSPYHQ